MSTIPPGSKEIQHEPLTVTLPNNKIITSHKTYILPIPHQLPEEARKVNTFPNLKAGALISIGKFCDHGCNVNFDKKLVQVSLNNEIILTGTRDYPSKLWTIDFSQQNNCNLIKTEQRCLYITPKCPMDKLIRFLHGALFSPTTSTLI